MAAPAPATALQQGMGASSLPQALRRGHCEAALLCWGGFRRLGVSHVPGRALPPDPVARRDHQDPNVCAAGLLASEILRRLGGENSSSVL